MKVIIIRILIVGVLLGGLGYGVSRFLSWRSASIREQLAVFRANLDDPSPQKRLEAAEGLIDDNPTIDLRMIRAQALIELNRHSQARSELRFILENDKSNDRKIQTLVIESLLAEARIDLLAMDSREPEQTLKRIETLMQEADVQIKSLVGGLNSPAGKTYNLRRLDVLARTLHRVLNTKRIELTVAEEAGVNESIQVLGLEVQTFEKQLTQIDEQLKQACESVLDNDPNNADAIEILFAYALRQGDGVKARQMAQHLAGLPTIDVGVAGRVADALLTLEVQHNLTLTETDVDLADRLLTHPNLAGNPSLLVQFARIRLALEQGKADKAAALAEETLPRASAHPRLRCQLAQAYIAQGKIDEAVSTLQQLGDTTNLPECQYVLGLAYLARGGQSEPIGMDHLRRCVELKPEHLPARMKLVESMVNHNFTDEAFEDLEFARKMNPHHPRVRIQAAKIAVMAEDMGRLSAMVTNELALAKATPSAEDHLLVAAMLLDDVQTVRRITTDPNRAESTNVLDLIAQPWLNAPADHRVPLACAVGRGFLDQIDSNPLMRAAPPDGPVVGAIATAAKPNSQRVDPLSGFRYVLGPAQLATQIAERGLDAWQHDAQLIQVLAEALLWSNQVDRAAKNLRLLPPAADGPSLTLGALRAYINDDQNKLKRLLEDAARDEAFDSPTVDLIRLRHAHRHKDNLTVRQTLQRMLKDHPWSMEIVLSLLRASIANGEAEKAYSWLGQVQVLNPELAKFSRALLNLSLNKPADALTEAESMIMDQKPQSELRRWSAEVRAIAFAQMDQPQMAVSTFDQLMLTMKEHAVETRIHSADVLAEMGKTSGSAEILSRLLARSQNPPHLIDRMLSRAVTVMKPRQVRALVETLLSYNPNDSILLLYQAKLTADVDNFLAEKRFKNILKKEPGAPRALMEWAAFNQAIQPDESIRIYEKLADRGGSVGDAAQRKLEQMTKKPEDNSEESTADPPTQTPNSTETGSTTAVGK